MSNPNEKPLLGNSDSLQLFPLAYPWAWDMYLENMDNHWTPREIGVANDVADWRGNELTEAERHLFLGIMAQLTTFDVQRGDETAEVMQLLMNPPEIKHYLKRLTDEEALHTWSYQYIIENLGLDQDEIYSRYARVPSMRNRVGLANDLSLRAKTIALQHIVEDRIEYSLGEKKQILLALIFWFLCFEGIWFVMGLSGPIQSLSRRKLFMGSAEQFQYIFRDECVISNTEVLTPQGWLPVQEVSMDTTLVQWHRDGTLSWTKPTALSSHEADSYYEFNLEGRGFKQRVSANHRFPYYTKDGNLKVVRAENATPNPYSHHVMTGPVRSTLDQPLTPVEQFQVAFQADGSTSDRYDGSQVGTIPVWLKFVKTRKIKRITEILAGTGWSYKTSQVSCEGNKKNQTAFFVNVPTGVILSKRLDEMLSLEDKPLSWCQSFIEEIAEWDGHIAKENPERITFSGTVETNVDFVQAAAALCGYRTKYSLVRDDRSEAFNDIHRLFISRHQNQVSGNHITKERKSGPVRMYGIEVPSSFILIRDDKNVSVTGNSQHVRFGVKLINEFIAQHPDCMDRNFVDAVYRLMQTTIDHERAFMDYCLPEPILGYNVAMHVETCKVYANMRLQSIGLEAQYAEAKHQFPWMSEMMQLKKEKNFFEQKPNEYRSGGALKWDE